MITLKFHDVEKNENFIHFKASSESKLIVFEIQENSKQNFVILDRVTAVKFSRELRKQIALLP
jgi:hypothetical protein